MKKKVLNIQIGNFWNADKKKNMPVILPVYPKQSKDGKKYYQAVLNIFVNEMEVAEKKEESDL